jgi:hypothetical protein
MLVFPPKPSDFKFAEAKSPRLRIVTYADATATIVVRGVTATGLLHDTYSTVNDVLIQTRTIALTEIPLTVSVNTSTTGISVGRIFCQIFLDMSGVLSTTLAAGYITTGQGLSYPTSGITPAQEGNGAFRMISYTDGATGADISLSVPTNTIYLVQGFRFTLTTDVNAAAREAIIFFRSAGVNFKVAMRPSTTQAASLVREYTFAPYSIVPTAFSTYIAGHMPLTLLKGGDGIATLTTNIQENDQYTAIEVYVRQWLNP